jgi:hypothetical protein
MTWRVMASRTQSWVGTAAAVLLALSSAALIAQSGDDDPVTEVLGKSVERTTSTTGVVQDTTTSLPAVLTPVPIEETTTSMVTGTTSTTAPGATTTTGVPVGRSVERADTTSVFDYRADGSGAMVTSDSAPPRDPFKFSALGSDVDHDGVAELRSTMANQTNRGIVFPEGLVLKFMIRRDGQQWRTVELRFPDTQSLPPGGSLEIESATPLQQQYGHYEVTGEVTIEYR